MKVIKLKEDNGKLNGSSVSVIGYVIVKISTNANTYR